MTTIFETELMRLRAIGDKLSFDGPTLARLTIGLVFIGTGWGKLHTLPDVTAYFASLHIPAPGLNARLAASTEFFGGILVLLGLGPLSLDRLVSWLRTRRGMPVALPKPLLRPQS